ncbi:MAG: ATP-binding protein [Burkholderiales bacterium]
MQQISRHTSLQRVGKLMRQFPAVALLGPRQVGKTTLARGIADDLNGVVFDLERPSDRLRLNDAELALGALSERLVVLDEVQRAPGLFETLRPLIDDKRRPGRFLLLGSASPALLRQASESLAGRMGIVELAPFSVAELDIDFETLPRYLLRGGFPQSWLAADDDASFEWRDAFVQSLLERDMPQLGFRFPAATLQRFWTMLAHWHGQLWNASRLAQSMGVSAPAINRYLDALAGAYLLRRLEPMEANVMKRLVKSPKVYVRDSGLLLSLLDVRSIPQLAGHPVAGALWEGVVIEQLIGAKPSTVHASFYRTARGAEVDLVLHSSRVRVAIECKFSSSPKPARGFHEAMADLQADRGFVIAPVREAFDLSAQVKVLPVNDLTAVWQALGA